MNPSRDSTTRRQAAFRLQVAIAGFSIVVAALVMLSLRFLLRLAWFGSIVTGLVAFFVIELLATVLRVVTTRSVARDMTWLFGNLPPLELRNRAARNRTDARFSPGQARPLPPGWRDALWVQVNNQSFSLGGRFEADKVFLAGFEEPSSVDRVRARALPDQTMMMARQCGVRSFGGEFVVAPMARGDLSSPFRGDTTAFLFFAKPDPARPFPPKGIERITIAVAGGWMMLQTVTKSYVDLASEMFGEPRKGHRGQRIWHGEDIFLVCTEEKYGDLHRSTFTWTVEDLDIPEAG